MEEKTNIRYSDVELSEFKALIEEKLERANLEFEFINNQISDLNGNSSDREGGDLMDDSSKQSELELLNSMVFRQRQFIQSLKNALIRIRNKTYGICVVTGQLIDKNRLRLVPHATKSIAGKNSVEPLPTIMKKSVRRSKPKLITKVIGNTSSKKVDSVVTKDELDGFDLTDLGGLGFSDLQVDDSFLG